MRLNLEDSNPFTPMDVLGREMVVRNTQQVGDYGIGDDINYPPLATDQNGRIITQEIKLTGIKDLWHSIIAGANQIDINNKETFSK